jgi:hypothetical protein
MRTVAATLVTVILADRPLAALACATCAASAFGDRTFNWSFLALMATPFLVAGVIGGVIFHAYRRKHESGR